MKAALNVRCANGVAAVVLAFVIQSAMGADTLISTGAVWKYLDDRTDQGTAWVQPNFDDSAWPQGPAKLGFGDGDEVTLLNAGLFPDRLITAYFRRSFSLAEASAVSNLVLRVRRDDGVVVYLNGVEVFRDNMPPGPITYSTFATAVMPDESAFITASISPGSLVNGQNVVAAEVHQVNAASSDLAFDLELTAGNATATNPPAAPPTIVRQPQSQTVVVGSDLTLSVQATGTPPLSYRWLRNGVGITNSTGPVLTLRNVQTNQSGVYSVIVTNVAGMRLSSNAVVQIFPAPGTNASLLVARGSIWKYFEGGVQPGLEQGLDWTAPAFDDSAWSSGPAQLGHGDNDEMTIVGQASNVLAKPITVYFRREFNVNHIIPGVGLTLSVLRDDGTVVYLNGREVFRSNMPDGPVSYSTLATVAVGGAEESTLFISSLLSPDGLAFGRNVLAVEIHQNAITSSDLSFDLELSVGAGTNVASVLSVVAADATASEIDPQLDQIPDPGVFRIVRSGPTNETVHVRYGLSGTASNGVDYAGLSGAIDIPAGATSVDIIVDVIDDLTTEADESVRLSLLPSHCIEGPLPGQGCYLWGSPTVATVVIHDNDPISPAAVGAPNDQLYPATASDGVNFLVVWMDQRNADSTEFDIYGARVSASGEVLDPGGIPICTARDYQWYPAVAFDGTNYLVVWSDSRDNSPEHYSLELYGARVSRSGVVLDPNGFRITHGEAVYQPSVAFNGTEYLATAYTWEHNGQRGTTVLGVRVTPAGVVRDTEELVIYQTDPGGSGYPVLVASLGWDWLVVWNGNGVEGARVERDGNVSSPIRILDDGSVWVHGLAAAGSNYFLASVASRPIGTDTHAMDVFGTWITPAGQPQHTMLIAANTNGTIGSHVQPTTYVQNQPAAIARGSDVLVVWEAGSIYTNGGNFMFLSDIRGARVSPNGVVSPTISICSAPQDQSYPAIAFSGQQFFATWQDARTAPPEEYSPGGHFDIYGARLTAAGALIDNDGLLISGVQSNPLPLVSILATDPHGAEEGSDPVVFTVTRTPVSNQPLRVYYRQVSSVFANGISLQPSSVEIQGGAASAEIVITPVDDTIVEGTEMLTLNLFPCPTANIFDPCPQTYRIGEPSSAQATIEDNDRVAVVTLRATDSEATEEGLNLAKFAFTRMPVANHPLVVYYSLEGTASNGLDYVRLSGAIEIPAGQASSEILIQPIDDLRAEGTETVTVRILQLIVPHVLGAPSPAYVVGDPRTADALILDNDETSTTASLIRAGSVWKYLDTGEDLGNFWRETDFNDWYWPLGHGQLGYGDGDETTVIRSSTDPSGVPRIVGYYFRHAFLIEERAQLRALTGRLLVDDGAVVYLNGMEVFRYNLPVGPIIFNTLAIAAGENQVVEFPIPLELLNNGFNVFAVEVHQNSINSSDVSFDLSVTAQRDPNAWPVVRLISPPHHTMANGPTNLTLVAEASDPDGRLVRVEFLQYTNLLGAIVPGAGQTVFSFIVSNVPPIGAHSFFARAIDDQGAVTMSRALSVGVVTYPIPPVVGVAAPDALVDEDPPRSASFVITRSPVRNTPLTVYFDLSGEAVNGEDFELVPLQITIPAGASSAEVVISVIDDFDVEDVDPVTLTLRATPPGYIPSFPPGPDGYFIDETQREATIRIEDDDVVLPPAVQIVTPARGSTFVAPAAIPITAEEFLWDYSLRTVEFFANDVSLGLADRSSNGISRSWSLVWSNPPPGEYSLGALAIDEFGRPSRATTIPISVVLFIPPQCPWPVEWQLVLSNASSAFKPTDQFKVVHPLPDGGYILGGESYSNTGDWDYWAVRIDGQGRVLWNRLLGGSSGDQLFDLQPTSDGGFVLGGWSSSGIEGTKTSPNYGGYDFWVVRLDANGNKLWDRSFGGAGHDGIYGLQQTPDGGYILGGASESNVGGNKTSPNRGMYDFWLVRLDASGNKLWDQSYGGAKRDFWAKARQTRDGGFVMFGTSESEPGGNKASPLFGQDNAWIVRTDANGNKLWDQSYGGNRHEWLAGVAELADGGLLFAGGSASDSGGNKTSPAFGEGDGLVLVLNADGSKRRDQSMGGTAYDWFLSLAPTSDGGFLIGGVSQSPVSGNKTSPNLTEYDPWLVWLDASGNKLLDRVAPGRFLDDVKPTSDGGVIIAGQFWQDASGFDGWAQKLRPLPEQCDADGDGVSDDHDQCPGTPTSVVVNADGCSLAQLCPCNGPWRNHGEYVRCAITHAWQFFRAGLITAEQRREFVRNAIRSDCGKREHQHELVQVHILPLTPEECRRDGFQIILSGDADSECMIESSSDLEHWLPLQTNSVTITGSEITCPLDDAQRRFFRVRLLH